MKKYDLKSFLKSMRYFISVLFIKKEYDVIFIYENHFNRGKNGENLFLFPMIESCKKNNIKYIVFEDTDLKAAFSSFPRNKEAIPLDFISLLRIIYRKFYKNKNFIKGKNRYYFDREKNFAFLMKKTFFKNFKFQYCINMAGENLSLFRGLDKNAILSEYQHGTIYNGHEDYLINNRVDNYIYKNKANFLVFGKGFKELLINQDKSGYYNENNVIDIGINSSLITKKNNMQKQQNIILFTSQLTTDLPQNTMKEYIKILKSLIDKNKLYFKKFNYKIIFKHHPRYNDKECPNIDLDKNLIEIVDSKETLDELLDKVKIHMTFRSTTAFEAGLKGVPTIFINMLDFFTKDDIFFEQYNYPLEDFKIIKTNQLGRILELIEEENKYEEISKNVYSWAREFYQDFDEEKFLNLIKKATL